MLNQPPVSLSRCRTQILLLNYIRAYPRVAPTNHNTSVRSIVLKLVSVYTVPVV